MKKVVIFLILALMQLYAQPDSLRPHNSIYKNFKPFSTPRTNFRPGTVYRIDEMKFEYLVQDVSSIKSLESDEGTVTGRMSFTKDEILENLNIEFNSDYVTAEVEIINALREVTEQTNVDNILWENDVAEELVVDPKSRYYIIRETISSKEIIYRFDSTTVQNIVSGKGYLKEKTGGGDTVIDYPFSAVKKFKVPKRLFYLEQKIGLESYSEKE
jgi:hypothetical protein